MMKAADKTAETVKSIDYAIFHPRKTAEEAVKAIKSAAKEKGGSYIGGYVLGEAAQAATLTVAGSTAKAAKAGKATKEKNSHTTLNTSRKNIKGYAKITTENSQGTIDLSRDELIVSNSKFLDVNGNIDWDTWAPNGGRVPGSVQEGHILDVGDIIDRYGNPYGKYVSPVGVTYEQRALPYIKNPNAYHRYEVIKPIDNVIVSQIAEAFEQVGGGVQYELPSTINKLIKDEFLREIK